MKINVLYNADGRIVALSPVSRPIDRSTTVAVLRSGPEPVDGQRLAVVDLDITTPSLREIHRRFVAVHTDTGVRLVERTTPSGPVNVSTAARKQRRRRRR
jgi:hypothetical protein